MIDTVRASREGHHFHEAWTARWALKLLAPKDKLIGIAVEGLSPADRVNSDDATAEIADLALYYGASPDFAQCDAQAILQLKYSIAKANVPLVASDMIKTLKKFSQSEIELLKLYGGTHSILKRTYCVVSNRPFGQHFLDAVEALKTAVQPTDSQVSSQLDQIKRVLQLNPDDHSVFASRLEFVGKEPTLQGLDNIVSIRINRWSAGSGLHTSARLGNLKAMIRAKAEGAGQNNNVIQLVDVLDVLQLEEVKDLLPTPEAFPPIRAKLTRWQAFELITRLKTLDRPLLVHGTGGMGKTVLMQQLRESAPDEFKVVLFDCFGGGAYRDRLDQRHRLDRGLLHIVNLLALEGLCDPLLPGQEDDAKMLRAAIRRLKDACTTLQEISPSALLVLILDSVDNSAQQASDLGEVAFPTELLRLAKTEGLLLKMRLVLTCRTERRHLLGKQLDVEEVALLPFTRLETAQYLGEALPESQPNDASIAFAQSGGTPRVLAYLAQHWHRLGDSYQQPPPITVEQLIEDYILQASKDNHAANYLDQFLAGLAVLPVPVPVADYAAAYNVTSEEVRSLFASLSPLLEVTPFGVIFRDEPTETWVRKRYASKSGVLAELADRLRKLQGKSHYAGIALPHLLVVLKDIVGAVELALNDSAPRDLLDTTGGRRIKIERVQAALWLAIGHVDAGIIARLIVEAGTLHHAAQKGSRYIATYPDLSAIQSDSDILLQLYRYRTGDPALRHARLTIAYLLSGAPDDAAQHFKYTREWLHKLEKSRGSASDTHFAHVAVSFYLLFQRDFSALFNSTLLHSTSDSFEITIKVLSLVRTLPDRGIITEMVTALRDSETLSLGLLAGVLHTLYNLSREDEAGLLEQLASAITATPKNNKLRTFGDNPLLDAAIRAYRSGQLETCRILRTACNIAPLEVIAFEHGSHGQDLSDWLIDRMLGALLCARQPTLMDILPTPLNDIAQHMQDPCIENIIAHLSKQSSTNEEETQNRESMVKTLRARIAPMMNVTALCAAILSSATEEIDAAVADLIALCTTIRDEQIDFESTLPSPSDLERLARSLTFRLLRSSQRFSAGNAAAFSQALDCRAPHAFEAIDYVEHFANQPALHNLAGEMADNTVPRFLQIRDLGLRRDAYASLARAILPVSPEVSYSLYNEGLKLIDDVGYTDTRFLHRVFSICQHADSSALNVSQASRFVSLCETGRTGHYGVDFPWLIFGKAATATLGYRALTLISRWDNDNHAGLSHSLAPVLVNLLHQQAIDAVQALALLVLETPEHWKSYQLDLLEQRDSCDIGVIDALVSRADLTFIEVIEELTQRIERDWELSKKLPTLLLLGLHTAVNKRPEDAGTFPERLAALYHAQQATLIGPASSEIHATNSGSIWPDPESPYPLVTELTAATDPCDSSSIQASWMYLEDANALPPQLLFKDLRASVQYAQRSAHVQALSQIRSPSGELDVLLVAIQDCLDEWHKTPSLKTLRTTLAGALISENLSALVGEPYALDNLLGKLAALGPTSACEVACNVVATACQRRVDVAPAAWLALGATLSQELDTQNLSDVVKQVLDSPVALLAERDDVGRHQDWLTRAGNVDDCIVDLLWLKLGDQNLRHRAAATDAIVFLARHERLALLEQLVARLNSRDVPTLKAAQGEFRFLDAKLSLALGLLRGLQSTQAPSLRLILQSMLDPQTCHPLLRQLALEAGATHEPNSPGTTAVSKPLPWESLQGPEAVLAEAQEEPVYLPRLAKTFALKPDVVATRIGAKMIEWGAAMPNVDLDKPQLEDETPSSRYRSAFRQRDFLEHLRWHALLTVGGEFADVYRSSSRLFDGEEWASLVRDAWDEYGVLWS
ncbi:P-loop NTPase family protein [Pseudomonas quasicaspiana]|uniref:NACHT domain-containing protein n=1 Tax=Pseudomonas quasicaspiana TaxID=2829821 RepID=UPI001E592FB2|nr:NACHT domain-containing protein [Pseudomonas quasicaspiana]MCD5977992.1 NACHT domain-containing protein [Pseudomonas quasicaspiana]